MGAQAIEIKCPGCGAPERIDSVKCRYCHQPLSISSFSTISEMAAPMVNKYAGTYKRALEDNPDDQTLNLSMGMCYLKLKLYDKALPNFEKAMEDNFDNSEPFFYAAICVLNGKKPFLHSRDEINKILEYVNAALMLEERGIYRYFLAYVKKDYFERKFLNISPNAKEEIELASRIGYSQLDVSMLLPFLGTEQAPF